MRILKLEVENFRGIHQATIPLRPGLNVLYGPNDLGKSTLAEAIRAALLVPSQSKEGKSYVRWDGTSPARVTLTFEGGARLWRVRKAFGSAFQAVLERSDSLNSPRFQEIAHGGGAEGRTAGTACRGAWLLQEGKGPRPSRPATS